LKGTLLPELPRKYLSFLSPRGEDEGEGENTEIMSTLTPALSRQQERG